ncbi:uncharacterized protein LY89DRAFT_72705 [Mollisia scopiformis]|uniref:Zn(2)-C6 fungal-type domain-containing protein n=1 Tax=Mollisia scopiformis TaxID=149040 RepID=A0A194XAG7_MOLSC|nr:uncharacterized protein LY89DRAFT_72705 [Mollisia scopiformis]KUJ17134.1 hypothetical protein LY89DRAFT_72705 [Mollisia scopiformis]
MLAPTRACTNCSLRRKKCDRSLPQCVRCVKSGKVCPGYSSETTTKFRDMTQISERKVRSRTATTGRGHEKSIPSAGEIFSNSSSVALHGFSKAQLDAFQRPRIGMQDEIARPLSTNWHETAIPRFFADYVSPSNVLNGGSFHFLLDLCNQQMCNVHFDEALRAVAYMSLANQLGKNNLSVEARKLYGSAIIRVATKVQNVEEALDDAILASSFLFSLFQIISIQAVPKGFWNVAHDSGRISLLRARGQRKSSGSASLNILGLVLAHNMHSQPPKPARGTTSMDQPVQHDGLRAWYSMHTILEVRLGHCKILRCSSRTIR